MTPHCNVCLYDLKQPKGRNFGKISFPRKQNEMFICQLN